MKMLIITGGELSYQLLNEVYDDTIDKVIVVDGGLDMVDRYNEGERHKIKYQKQANPWKPIKIDLIIGDFDTVRATILEKYKKENVRIEPFPSNKDYTDTHLALEVAIRMGAKEVIIIGATGSRMDHTLANIGLLGMAFDNNIHCKIINSNNEMQMIEKQLKLVRRENYFISIIPVTQAILGVTLEGFQYPLQNATIHQGETIGISNTIVEDTGIITIKMGRALIIEARD